MVSYKYKINSYLKSITFENKTDNEKSLEFNVIIPLYDIVNINYKSSFNNISTDDVFIDLTDYNNLYIKNIPLGIWFADRDIELRTDGLYGQTWSLAIGSQFKPLPTMQNNYSDVSGNNSSALEYSTFAQILARQNGLLKSYQDLIVTVNNLTNRIQELEKQIDTTNI
jgi:chitinase